MAQNDKAFRVKTGIELETLGSNTAPVYSFSGDPNTGIYSSAADNLDVTAGGTQIINATGTVVTFKGTAVANAVKLTEDSTTGGFLLSLLNNSGLTTDRTLTFNVNNANRTISLSADLTVSNTASVSGTNTGDQNIIQTIALGADTGYTWGSSNVVADTTSDTITLVPEVGVVLNTDATLDAIKIGVRTGSTSQTGILQLTDSTSSTSTTTAATPNSVKSTYDSAVHKSGSTSTGKQTFAAPAAGYASILLPNGAVDPSSPVSGDLWVNTGVMKYYNGSATKTIPFSDGTIQVATTITTASDTSDTTCYPVFVNAASASNQGAKYNSNLAFDALNNVLSVAGGNVLSSGGALGTTGGDSLTPLKVEATSSNADKLHAVIERQTNGSTSATARWKIKRTVDTTDAGFITIGNTNVLTFGKNATTYATFYDGGHFLINTGTDDTVNFLQVAGGISASGGSNSAPGYTFAGDLNTGVYSASGDTLGLSTGGTGRLTIASTGDVTVTSTTASSSSTTGALIVGGGIGVAGTSYIAGVINATNATASSNATTGAVVVTGGVGIGGAVNTTGAVTTSGIVTTTNNTASSSTSTGAIVATGGVGIGGALYVGGLSNIAGVLTAASSTTSTSTSSGALVVTGGVGVGENLYVGGVGNVAGVLTAASSTASSSTSTGALVVTGGVGIGGAMYTGGLINTTGTITTSNNTTSTTTATGAVVVTGGVGIGENLYVGGVGNVVGVLTAASSTASTSTTSGALVVTGGVGIGGAMYTGGLINTTGTITTSNSTTSTTSSTGAVVVTGGVGIGENLNVGGTFASGAATITGALTTTGDVNVNGGDLITSVTGTASLFNTNATALNIGGAATAITMGTGAGIITLATTGAVILPSGTEGQRPVTETNGMLRYSSTSAAFEGFANDVWITLGATDTSDTSPTANSIAKRDASADLYANSFISSSDARLKENILNITNAVDVVSALQGVTFSYISSGQKSAGFIAQELEKILPDLVNTNEDGMKSVNYLGIIAYLVEAIKELRG